jgi:hypothetical protein
VLYKWNKTIHFLDCLHFYINNINESLGMIVKWYLNSLSCHQVIVVEAQAIISFTMKLFSHFLKNCKNNWHIISGVFFNFHLKVGVEESIVNALRITDQLFKSYVFIRMVRSQSTLQHQLWGEIKKKKKKNTPYIF